ncbi:MAG: HEAT repeat domain-containing protein [Candidatus Lokiarchaeota archaeon]|nr:HEAT repeat domain-containing protein [Candidatus Lokiarchaeota archaeon]
MALVKKGEFRFTDRLQCLIYGLLFSIAVMVVVGMAFIFADNTLHPLILIIPFAICLVYVSIYPLIDFLFIALSEEADEGLTPFHRFLSKYFINISGRKIISALMAILLYLFLIIPPIVLSLLGLPYQTLWISWMLFYPLLILTYYGSKGYISGISNQYYHIPEIKRNIFLNFEDNKRGMQQFLTNPSPFIMLSLMLFVFVWAWISLFQTIGFFFTGSLAISTMSSYFVYVTLFFGIVGYFTRFWGRKIKYRGIDIYFAAYLMAAIGVNVLVNFLIVNIDILSATFNYWFFTKGIVPVSNSFAWPAIIEESILIIITSYFFLVKKNEFKFNIKYSKITECGQIFDPIPLFNFIKNPDPKLRKHAENTLLLMFERIPLKSKKDLNDWKFKDSLMDGICDPNPNSREISIKILTQLESDVPDIVLPWIIEALESPNYDKCISVARSLVINDNDLVEKLPKNLFINLITDPEWRLRLIGMKLLRKINIKEDELISKFNLIKFINDPNVNVQVELLKLLSESSYQIPQNIIFEKLSYPQQEIRAAAIQCLNNIDMKKIDLKLITKIIPFLKDPRKSVRASMFEILSKIGKFKKLSIPISPILDGLTDSGDNVRNSAVNALEKYYSESPKALNLDAIISKIDVSNMGVLSSIISLLGRLWHFNPEKILTTLLIYIKLGDTEVKQKISSILTQKSENKPLFILKRLIVLEDDSGFISKGIISTTVSKIASKYPVEVLPFLHNNLISEDPNIVLNAIVSLENLIENNSERLILAEILKILKPSLDPKIKKVIAQIISKIAKKNPFMLKPVMNDLLISIEDLDANSKVMLMKSFLDIVKNYPELIPVRFAISFLQDNDSFVREASTKILGYIGYKVPLESTDALINISLKDEEWIVRDAAVLSLGSLINEIKDNEETIRILVMLLEDKNSWVKRSAMNLLSSISGLDPDQIPFKNVEINLKSEDPKVREGVANLLKIFGFTKIDMIFDSILLLLGDESKDVRNNMINSMVSIIQEKGLVDILSKLLKNLSDEGSITSQQSIAIILGRTARYEDDKIKKRIIALLKIRCEASQDPIICETLNKLKED